VGAIGFLVDASILTVLVTGLGWGHYGARAISFATAVTVTWYLNRRWTFAKRACSDRRREYSRYFIVQAIGAVINLGVYSLCIELYSPLAAVPIVPLAIGAGIAMIFNFLASRYFAFRGEGGAVSPTQ
jgi:putative flippase GtrA